MKIRKFTTKDLEEKKEVHLKAIREVDSTDYSEKQIDAWSDYGEIEDNVERWVAEEDGEIIGFSDYRPDKARVTGVYVDPDHLRKGVGSGLLEKVFKDAKNRGIEKLTCESSVTAKKFYEKHGFEVVEGVVHETKSVEMKAFEMEKRL